MTSKQHDLTLTEWARRNKDKIATDYYWVIYDAIQAGETIQENVLAQFPSLHALVHKGNPRKKRKKVTA